MTEEDAERLDEYYTNNDIALDMSEGGLTPLGHLWRFLTAFGFTDKQVYEVYTASKLSNENLPQFVISGLKREAALV
jgi:hypothetical protein